MGFRFIQHAMQYVLLWQIGRLIIAHEIQLLLFYVYGASDLTLLLLIIGLLLNIDDFVASHCG
jgi:hypothetical protein